LLALIAHELRHAVEVIDHSEVIDVPTLEAMYSRIGTPLTAQIRGYETSAARAAGDAVLAELMVTLPAPVSRVAHRSQPKGEWMTRPLPQR
jgi:hypothetical protein